MGLLPLEFTDCLQDSPYFRDSLHSHEKELERTSQAIKELIKEVKALLHSAKALSQAQRRLSQRLVDFKFECIGNRQTDDEVIITSSLKEFGKLIGAIEDEKDRMLERAYEQFIEPLEKFRREQIGSVKENKKKFEKQTAKFCASQERYLGLSTKKQDTVLQEADATLEMEQRDFIRAGLEYVSLIQEVQEKKKFEFVETLLAFMYGWLTFYHQGHEVAKDFAPHMRELQSRIQKTRENFNSSRDDINSLMTRMLEVRNSKQIDPGTLNKLYTRTGYLFLMEKKALGTTSWNKYYCHFQKDERLFCMIPYNQTAPKIYSNETFKIKACIKRVSESIDKRFCFDIIPEDKPGSVYTFQALSEEDRSLWMDAMDGKEPMFVHPPKPSDANETYLDEAGFSFVQKCFGVLEARGLEDQGLYRVVGVNSKVTKLLTYGLDRRKSEKLLLNDPMEWESKTITSAIKQYFRNLPEPIMTFRLHNRFIAAAKLDTYEDRVSEVHSLIVHLPEPNKRMLELLLAHLEKVALNSEKNMMSVSNLGVCFGPTLLRDEEESVAAIMDIKFGNVVVEIFIENWRKLLLSDPSSSSHQTPTRRSQLTVLPVGTSKQPRTVHASPPSRPPPPYQNPPPPPGISGATAVGSVATLAHAVIYNNGPNKAIVTPKGPPAHSPPLPPTSSSTSSSHFATWERPSPRPPQTVPAPLPSAPPNPMSSSYAAEERPELQRKLSAGGGGPSAINTSLQSDSTLSISSVEYPPLAPRPQLSPRPLPPHLVKKAESSSSSVESLTSGSSRSTTTGMMAPVAAPRTNVSKLGDSSSTSEARSVRTLYACVAEHETELSFEPNQIVTSVRPSLEPGWLEGCLDGKCGLIPENYVEFIN